MKRSFLVLVPLLLLLTFCFTSCVGEKEIRIGVLLPMSGNAKNYGESILKGVKLAAEQINAQGIKEFAGYKLILVEQDTASDPDTGKKAMMHLLDRSGGDCYAILGPASSSVALACAPIAMQRKRVMLTPAASEPEITKKGNYIFRIYPSDTVEGRKMADFARKQLFIKRLAVLAENTEYAQGLKKVFIKGFRENGGEVLQIENIPVSSTDLAGHIEAIKKVTPQGIYIVGYDEMIENLLKEIHKQEVVDDKGKLPWILSCGAFDSPHVFENACDVAEKVIFPRVDFDCRSEGEAVIKFCEAFKAKFGHEPDTFAAHGYDAVNLLVHSIEVQGGLYPQEMPMVLATTSNWKGVSGAVTFDANGDVLSKFPKVFIVKECRAMSWDKLMDYLREQKRVEAEQLMREIEERKKELGRQ